MIDQPTPTGEIEFVGNLPASSAVNPTPPLGPTNIQIFEEEDLVARGADLPAVMQAGRWKTPAMPARYAERLLAGRGAVARFHERRGD